MMKPASRIIWTLVLISSLFLGCQHSTNTQDRTRDQSIYWKAKADSLRLWPEDQFTEVRNELLDLERAFSTPLVLNFANGVSTVGHITRIIEKADRTWLISGDTLGQRFEASPAMLVSFSQIGHQDTMMVDGTIAFLEGKKIALFSQGLYSDRYEAVYVKDKNDEHSLNNPFFIFFEFQEQPLPATDTMELKGIRDGMFIYQNTPIIH